jgi:phosphohistidine phosphatase
MKTLLIMRHAKSDWGAAFEADHDRPLARRGEKAARRIGRFLSETGIVPQLILSSTALRAHSTAILADDAGGWGCPIQTNHNLYAADIDRVLEVVAGVEPEIGCLMIIGHEPTWSSLVSWLMGGGRLGMPTAAVACLDLRHGDWAGLAQGSCELRWLLTPKALKSKKAGSP